MSALTTDKIWYPARKRKRKETNKKKLQQAIESQRKANSNIT
jgi:hypothetical protein